MDRSLVPLYTACLYFKIFQLSEEGKRVLVLLQPSHLLEFLDLYQQCVSLSPGTETGVNGHERAIILTSDESIPFSLDKARKSHPNWHHLEKLYEKRAAAQPLTSQRSEIESINQEIDKLYAQMDDDIFDKAQILVNFNSSLLQPKHLQRFKPDIQIIDDVSIVNNSHCFAVISQVPSHIFI